MSTPWSFLDPDDTDPYEMKVEEGDECTPPSEATEYMLDVRVPRQFWPFHRKTKVLLWTAKDCKWHLVALFVSSHAAIEYAHAIARKLLEVKNAQTGSTSH